MVWTQNKIKTHIYHIKRIISHISHYQTGPYKESQRDCLMICSSSIILITKRSFGVENIMNHNLWNIRILRLSKFETLKMGKIKFEVVRGLLHFQMTNIWSGLFLKVTFKQWWRKVDFLFWSSPTCSMLLSDAPSILFIERKVLWNISRLWFVQNSWIRVSKFS